MYLELLNEHLHFSSVHQRQQGLQTSPHIQYLDTQTEDLTAYSHSGVVVVCRGIMGVNDRRGGL